MGRSLPPHPTRPLASCLLSCFRPCLANHALLQHTALLCMHNTLHNARCMHAIIKHTAPLKIRCNSTALHILCMQFYSTTRRIAGYDTCMQFYCGAHHLHQHSRTQHEEGPTQNTKCRRNSTAEACQGWVHGRKDQAPQRRHVMWYVERTRWGQSWHAL
jgi:hypothetical protein